MTFKRLPFALVMAAAFAAIMTMGTGPTQSEDWPKVDGLSYLEMPDNMYDQLFKHLSWCRATVETPEKRLDELRGGFPEQEAKEILKVQQDECVRGADIRMRHARTYGYVGEKEAVFDAEFWTRLDEARENLK